MAARSKPVGIRQPPPDTGLKHFQESAEQVAQAMAALEQGRCPCQQDHDDVRELAMLIRQGMKLIVAGIERKYALGDAKDQRAA